MDWNGKTAIVTGATGGFPAGTAEIFLRNDHQHHVRGSAQGISVPERVRREQARAYGFLEDPRERSVQG